MNAPSAELLEIRDLARDFALSELRPHAEASDAGALLDPTIVPKVAELGFFGMLVPESAGGMGFDHSTYLTAVAELAWGEPAAALLVVQNVIAADLIVRYGDTALAEEWLPRLSSGAGTACLAFADDAPGVSAARAGDALSLSGTHRLVLNAPAADLALVAVMLDGAPVLCAVPRTGGYQVGTRAATLGLRALGMADLTFDNVRVPQHSLLPGAPAHAADYGTSCLSAAAVAVGIAQAALDHAVRYGDERQQFGRAIRSFEGIQVKLAEMATRTAAARALVQSAAQDAGNAAAGAMAKLAAGTCAMYVTTDAVQIFGGYGYMRDYPVEKLMRDAKALELVHGSNEALRLRIAASLYT